jgi:hypothetical protein
MPHRFVHDPLEEMNPFDHSAAQRALPRVTVDGRLQLAHGEEQGVELLPHVGADFLANLTAVVACRGDARRDGVAIGEIEECCGDERRSFSGSCEDAGDEARVETIRWTAGR